MLVGRRLDERISLMAKQADALSNDSMSVQEKAIALGNLVVENMGGAAAKPAIGYDGMSYMNLRQRWLDSSHQIKQKGKTYVVKLGDLSCGMSRHR